MLLLGWIKAQLLSKMMTPLRVFLYPALQQFVKL